MNIKAELQNMNISDLRFVCRELGVYCNGNKKGIIKRLLEPLNRSYKMIEALSHEYMTVPGDYNYKELRNVETPRDKWDVGDSSKFGGGKTALWYQLRKKMLKTVTYCKKFAREKLSKDVIKQKREYIIKTIIEKYGENVLNSENITSSVIVDMADLISKEFFENAFEKLGIRLIVCYDNSCCKGTRNVKGQEIELNPNDSGICYNYSGNPIYSKWLADSYTSRSIYEDPRTDDSYWYRLGNTYTQKQFNKLIGSVIKIELGYNTLNNLDFKHFPKMCAEGISCNNTLGCIQLVLEHEMVHAIIKAQDCNRYAYLGNFDMERRQRTSKDGCIMYGNQDIYDHTQTFMSIANSRFGHTVSFHDLKKK